MPTERFTGAVVSQITTPGVYWSAPISCADVAENFIYFYDKDSGDLFKAALPGLTGLVQLNTMPNIADMRAMCPHPTNAGLLVFFNTTDGVGTIDTATGVVVSLLSAAAFNALLTGTLLEVANIGYAKLRGNKIMINGGGDPTGAVFLYDPDAGTADLLVVSHGYQELVEAGEDPVNELLLSSYGTAGVFYSRNLVNDEVSMVAGNGVANLVDGEALLIASFYKLRNLRRMASDLFYQYDADFNKVRWIQGGFVGSYNAGVIGGNNFCCLLPNRAMAVSIDVQGVTVWS